MCPRPQPRPEAPGCPPSLLLYPLSGTGLPPPGVSSWWPTFRTREEPAEEAGSGPEIWLVALENDGKTAGQPAPTLRGSQREYQKPQRPPYGKDRAPPPPHTKHTRPVEHMHAHPRASTYPQTGGKRQKTPVTPPVDPISVSYHICTGLSASGRIPAKHLGTYCGSKEKKGCSGSSANPHLCHPSLPPDF